MWMCPEPTFTVLDDLLTYLGFLIRKQSISEAKTAKTKPKQEAGIGPENL
jgi:hypothetical protein